MNDAFIYEAIRTPRGKARADGGLAGLSPFELVGGLYAAMIARTGLDPEQVDDVLLGCVTQHGDQAANIAKTSLLYAGWPDQVPGMTVNRFCSSGLDAVNFASLKVQTGQASACLAGGVESMSSQPMLADGATVFTEPAHAARCRMLMMGSGADLVATRYGITREQVDTVALHSQQRAAAARESGRFHSIIPVSDPRRGTSLAVDECIRPQTSLDGLAQLEPAFATLGAQGIDALQLQEDPALSGIQHVHTAGNSPALADGAALVLVGGEALGRELGRAPRGRIVAASCICGDPLEVVSGCAAASAKLLNEQRLRSTDIDLFELHEAFAAIALKCQRDLQIDAERLNVNGGVIALGHPLGATGAMMLGMLLDEMERCDMRRGVVAASGAAGIGTALLIERH